MAKGDGQGKGGGPRPTPIDWAQAAKLAFIQCTCNEIAAFFGICSETLVRRCKQENKLGYVEWFKINSEHGKSSLRRSMWKLATGERPNAGMAIWLSKQYLGMRDSFDEPRPPIQPTLIVWQDKKIQLGSAEVVQDAIVEEAKLLPKGNKK
jgi:hypothetical protein